MVVACLLAGVGVAALVDAVRSDREAGAPGVRTTAGGGPSASLARELESEGVEGVLYWSDPSDHCRVRALRLPALVETPPPKLRACRFELPQEPGTASLPQRAVWHPARPLGAACVGAHVELSTADGDVVEREAGCAPAWKPDGTLTVIRRGEVWSACVDAVPAGAGGCGQKLLSAARIAEAADFVPFVPSGRRFLRSATPTHVAWLSSTRSAVLVRVVLRGRFARVGPLRVLAFYEGRRLVDALQYAGAIGLRPSPLRSFVGVVEGGGRVAIVDGDGREWLAATDLPAPAAHALAWSPDQQWTAIATPWSVYLLRTAEIIAGRTPRIVRLPLVVRDLAWR